MAYPAERSLLAVSRISQQTHTLVPPHEHEQDDGWCSPPTTPQCLTNASYSVSQTFLVAQLERFTILVDHALVGASSSFTSKHMRSGQLLDPAGQPMDPCDDYPPVRTSPRPPSLVHTLLRIVQRVAQYCVPGWTRDSTRCTIRNTPLSPSHISRRTRVRSV